MHPAEDRPGLARPFRTAMIIAAAVLASLLIYVLAAELFLRGKVAPFLSLQPEQFPALRIALYGAAVAAVVALRLARGLVLRKKPGEEPSALGRKLLLASVLTSALAEVPALLGLVLFLAAGLNRDLYILTAVSVVLMFMYFPRLGQWREWVAGP